MVRVSILGATGYTGAELIRVLLRHPGVRIKHLTSRTHPGKKVEDLHPSLRGACSLAFEKLSLKTIASDSDVAFLALPAGEAMLAVRQLLARGCRVIDLSPDFRLKDKAAYRRFYAKAHKASSLLKTAAYGLPEVFREKIRTTRLVANPGCYATAAILAIAPLASSGMMDGPGVIVDAKSGVSGAGNKLEPMYNFSEANENMVPYSVAHHRHTPEMEEVLSHLAGRKVIVTFTPQLAPMTRGILSVAYAKLRKKFTLKQAWLRFAAHYRKEPFVRVLPLGQMPQTKEVLRTNFCDIGLAFDRRTRSLIVVSVLDNLMKGASGQAAQNMNLMCGFRETEGLL